jgi:hypothetical protein
MGDPEVKCLGSGGRTSDRASLAPPNHSRYRIQLRLAIQNNTTSFHREELVQYRPNFGLRII